jgi:hypothetical protein
MRTIYKYELVVTDDQFIHPPVGAEFVSCQEQGGTACLWALVDPEKPPAQRHIRIHGTGHPMPHYTKDSHAFLGTFQLNGGSLVFHVFEVRP